MCLRMGLSLDLALSVDVVSLFLHNIDLPDLCVTCICRGSEGEQYERKINVYVNLKN